MSESQAIYRVSFLNQGNIYEVFCRKVYQADMYGFIAIEELVFGERSSIVVDPAEERLKDEFDSVKRSFIPMHAMIRIDEVSRQGTARITEIGDKVAVFPGAPGGSWQAPNKKDDS
jgi:hypothetical protein